MGKVTIKSMMHYSLVVVCSECGRSESSWDCNVVDLWADDDMVDVSQRLNDIGDRFEPILKDSGWHITDDDIFCMYCMPGDSSASAQD